ncbi:MAG: sacsin N-terminal ATP-binding-like domain-containing protein, partial [Mycobacteriales bacterium]
MPGDPFDTEGVRRRVLDAWADSPARFREDANAEEDYALGGYRDRLIVELAQNASDAAAIAAEPGLLRIRLHAAELCVANTGAPLDAAGVAALASLRASAKRGGGTVGRFGVGFAAVLAVTGEPSILSTSGGVRFSAAATRHEVDALPGLADEVEHRAGAVPVLRLPWPAPGLRDPPFTTEVRLPLPAGVADRVRAILDAVDAGLLLALPGLTQIDIDGRVLRREDDGADAVTLVDGSRRTAWRVHRAAGAVA